MDQFNLTYLWSFRANRRHLTPHRKVNQDGIFSIKDIPQEISRRLAVLSSFIHLTDIPTFNSV